MKALLFNPAQEPQRAVEFLAAQPAKVRQWVMPHINEAMRGHAFAAALRCGSHACIIYEDGKPQTLGWLVPVSPKARSAWAHFILPPMKRHKLLPCASALMTEGLKLYDSLTCLVPAPLHGVRNILEHIGFSRLAVLPKACRIETKRRNVDGIFYFSGA